MFPPRCREKLAVWEIVRRKSKRKKSPSKGKKVRYEARKDPQPDTAEKDAQGPRMELRFIHPPPWEAQ